MCELSMKKELDVLMDHFRQKKNELEADLKTDPTNEFIKGKLEGIKYASVIISIYNYPEDLGHPIDVEID